MLLQLNIRNIALIDEVSIEFGEGLNVLTGETGAGKSIIIDSINAVLGGRVSRDLIRSGKDKAIVEAVFVIDNDRFEDIFDETGIDKEEDGTLIISREFSASGKNICRINGKMATVTMLKIFGERLVDVHGQHDNHSLLRVESHAELLDSFGGDRLQNIKETYQKYLSEYKDIEQKLKRLGGDEGEREKKIDLIKYQVNEIQKAKLTPGEEEALNRERMFLSNAEKIISSLSEAYELLYSGNNSDCSTIDNLNNACGHIRNISRFGEKFENLSERLNDIIFQLEDVIEEIRNERDSVEYDPKKLEEVEERLDLIHRLKRKYGGSIPEVLKYCSELEEQLEELEKSEEIIASLNRQLLKTEDILYNTAIELNQERKVSAGKLEKLVAEQLEDLEMPKARFKVDIRFDEKGRDNGCKRVFGRNGLDQVEFLISPNAGEPLKPLAKIASGGELSRIMLAIKTILAQADKIPTLIFDEIDIGISGKAAKKVSEKLSYLSGNHQVICVTHLPQIACMADNHFLIEKFTESEITRTFVKRLDDKQTAEEIARMLGGSGESETSLVYANELLRDAGRLKDSLREKTGNGKKT